MHSAFISRRANCPKLFAQAILFFGTVFSTLAQSNEFRGVWIDAWGTGFLNASQVTQLIADCRTYNYNAVVVQMRRRGDAFYTPGITGNDPKTTAISSGFDALADIISKAHDTSGGKQRIEVHCWVTTFVIWSGTTPPSQSGHVLNLHPEYLMKDSSGTNYIAEGYYLDPGNPNATMWNYVMATNIVRRYDVDGFHWDYIRYPANDSGYNDTAISRYNAEFGLTGQPSPSSAQFSDWRRRQVTDFLRWVNGDLLAIRTNLVISCAVFGSRSDAHDNRFQDWAAWNSEGIIDICMPMGYTSGNTLFNSRVDDAFTHQGVRRVYNGQGAYLNSSTNTVTQLNYIRNKPLFGSVIYSYRTPNSGTPNISGTLSYIKTNFQPTWTNVPTIPWKVTPTKGIIKGTVTRSDNGAAIYNATVQIPGKTQKTEPHGKYDFFETTPGTYSITATTTGMGTVTNNVTVAAGQIVTLDLVVPATDNTPPVISSVASGSVTDTSAIIMWATDENANSAVDYGTTISYGSVASNATQSISHSTNLTGLAPNTTYHFRVRSRNAANLESVSGDFTFTTNPSGVVNDVIVESRLSDGSLNINPPYTDSSFSDSTLKSTAAGLTGTGSRYAVSGTPNYTVKPTLPVASASYDVYLTHGSAGSISDDIIVAVTQTSCTGLPATTTIFQQSGGNTWEYLGQMKLNSGATVPTLKFTYSSGTLDAAGNGRMYSDSIKFVYVPPPTPPSITTPPSSRTVNQGANTTFNVTATGDAPLSYQWCFEGTNIVNATASNYTLNNVQPTQEGDYSAVVTNVGGSITSSIATLTVNIPPVISTQPQSQTIVLGDDASFTVSADGTEPLLYQWRFGGTNISGATDSSYTRSNAQTNHAGNYSVAITNAAGFVISSNAALTVNVPPTITSQPQNLAVNQGSNATFSVSATGTSTLMYQWQFSGTNISGATLSSYTRNNAQPADAGIYAALVTNVAGLITSSNATLTVNVLPTITNQPQSLTVGQGADAIFSVSATGTPTPTYQWRFNGTNISGATQSSYIRTNAQFVDAGTYSAIATNVVGSVTSSNALLAVFPPPTIIAQPQSLLANLGSDATFSVTATSAVPFGYQWRFKGTNLSAATQSSYTRSNAQTGDTGNYSVLVTNAAGSVASSNAHLTVISMPVQFSFVTMLSDGRAYVRGNGDPGNYEIEVTTNLNLLSWETIAVNLANTNGTFEWIDPVTNNFQRYFRAKLTP